VNKRYYLALGAVAVLTILAVFVVGPVYGKTGAAIGIVDMDKVISEYMAKPLLEARDELQAKFDAESAELEDEAEISQLFRDYQVQLTRLENEYRGKIHDAIAEVGQQRGFEVILPAAGVLYGGVDVTAEVLAVLK
jgi:Skp family chaperone for outer membrane proteins